MGWEAQPIIGYQAGDGDLTDNDSDGDVIVDLFDSNDGTVGGFGGSFGTPVNTDGAFTTGATNPNGDTVTSDIVADNLDTDSDGDGILDVNESGIGTPTADNNNDGIGDNITGVSFQDPGGAPNGTDLSASNLLNVDADMDSADFRAMCFTSGTLIKTIKGEVPIETLTTGDRVLTMDGNYQEIRWIGSRALDAIDLAVNPRLRPIIIRADALGAGFPAQDLIVSPQHRILVRSAIAECKFGTREVLIPANKLLTLDGIDVLHHNPNGLEYWHMLFDDHQIIWSNGSPTESLFTGPEALKAVSPEGRLEIQTLFPEIFDPNFKPVAARYIPEKGKLMKKLAQRHLAENKPMYSQR